jgi:hypothetical protein
MAESIEIIVGEVNDIEARVYARYVGSDDENATGNDQVVLHGTLRGPFCETARTLPAEFAFHNLNQAQPPTAEAVVPDPCTWSPELPHLYEAVVEARQGVDTIAKFQGMIGLRRSSKQ